MARAPCLYVLRQTQKHHNGSIGTIKIRSYFMKLCGARRHQCQWAHAPYLQLLHGTRLCDAVVRYYHREDECTIIYVENRIHIHSVKTAPRHCKCRVHVTTRTDGNFGDDRQHPMRLSSRCVKWHSVSLESPETNPLLDPFTIDACTWTSQVFLINATNIAAHRRSAF